MADFIRVLSGKLSHHNHKSPGDSFLRGFLFVPDSQKHTFLVKKKAVYGQLPVHIFGLFGGKNQNYSELVILLNN